MTQKDPALTMTGDIVGTLRYMSPEQALGKRHEMNYRTDIYSLGVTLYELLTLQPAFAGENRETLVRRLLEDDPPRPRTVNRAIPKDLETIVLKATAKEPPQRYASAQEMADDLQAVPGRRADPRQAVRAAGQRLKKWTKRHKAVTAVVAAVAVGGGDLRHGDGGPGIPAGRPVDRHGDRRTCRRRGGHGPEGVWPGPAAGDGNPGRAGCRAEAQSPVRAGVGRPLAPGRGPAPPPAV